jgi:hypothetical protein
VTPAQDIPTGRKEGNRGRDSVRGDETRQGRPGSGSAAFA